MTPAIITTVHTKPTHLHSHLLLPPHTGKRSKSKRECKQPHPFAADRACKTQPTLPRADRRAADNKGLKEMAGEVVNQTFVLSTYICGMLTVCASKPPLL